MKNNHKIIMVMLIGVVVLLTACENSSEESKALDNQPQNNTDSGSIEKNSSKENLNTNSSDSENNDTNEKADTDNNDSTKEDSSTNSLSGVKDEYVQKLNDAKKEMEEMRENPIDGTTFAMKKVEGDLYDIWDGLLNEIYGVLKKQLPSEEMDKLRQEQRDWIDYRDKTAKEASLKYKGGTMEQLEYVTVQNNLTVERCFELVEEYME